MQNYQLTGYGILLGLGSQNPLRIFFRATGDADFTVTTLTVHAAEMDETIHWTLLFGTHTSVTLLLSLE
jgi:hypothetical protein